MAKSCHDFLTRASVLQDCLLFDLSERRIWLYDTVYHIASFSAEAGTIFVPTSYSRGQDGNTRNVKGQQPESLSSASVFRILYMN